MTPERAQKISDVEKRRFASLAVIIERVDDPHNLGAILRTCDAVGVGEVHLVYPTSRGPRLRELTTKSAASAVKWLTIRRWTSVSSCVASLHRRTFIILVAALSDHGKPQWEWNLRRKIAIAVGNEHEGASPHLLRLADGVITIPMRGMVQSLNVSVAAAVILEEALRQRV
ncbi:MAG: RNA methyltransferase [Patescibacteria group bacterium]